MALTPNFDVATASRRDQATNCYSENERGKKTFHTFRRQHDLACKLRVHWRESGGMFICSSVMKFNSLQNDLSFCRSLHFRWDSSIPISELRSGWRTHSTLSWDLGDVLTSHWAEIWVTYSLRTELGSGWLTHLRHGVFRVCTLNIFSWVLRFRKRQSFVKLNIKHSSYELKGMKSRVLFFTLIILT